MLTSLLLGALEIAVLTTSGADKNVNITFRFSHLDIWSRQYECVMITSLRRRSNVFCDYYTVCCPGKRQFEGTRWQLVAFRGELAGVYIRLNNIWNLYKSIYSGYYDKPIHPNWLFFVMHFYNSNAGSGFTLEILRKSKIFTVEFSCDTLNITSIS